VGKRRTGEALANRPLVANASMTFIDGCLAGGILIALALNAAFGWCGLTRWPPGVVAASPTKLVKTGRASGVWRSLVVRIERVG